MARMFIDGFESGNAGLWDAWSTTETGSYIMHKNHTIFTPESYNFEQPKIGNYCFYINNSSTSELRLFSFDSYPSIIYIKFRFQLELNVTTTYSFAQIRGFPNTSVNLGTLRINTSNALTYLPTRSTEITSNLTFELKKWHNIELYLKIGAANGEVQLRMNGISYPEAGPITGIDTRGSTTGAADYFGGIVVSLSSVRRALYDDFVIDDTNFPGDGYISALFPNAQGTPYSFDGVSGDPSPIVAVSSIGNIEDVDNTYIYDSLSGRKASFGLQNMSAATHIYSVQVCYRCKREGVPEATMLKPYIQPFTNGTPNYGQERVLPIDIYKTYRHIWETNPFNSNVPFTTSDINNLNIGIETV